MTTDHRAEAEELLRHRNVSRAWPHIALHALDVLAARLPQTPPPSTPAAAPQARPGSTPDRDTPSAERPSTGQPDPATALRNVKGAGRIGWLRPGQDQFRYLVREVEGGWSGRDHDHNMPEWDEREWVTFTPLLDGFFVAPDGDDVPTIWREMDGEPVWVMVRTPYFAAFFDAVAGLLEKREEA